MTDTTPERTTRDRMIDEFTTVLSEAEGMLKKAATETGDKARDLRTQVESKLLHAKLRLQEIEGAAVDNAKAAARATDDYVHDNPWQAVGVAAAVGFLDRPRRQPPLGRAAPWTTLGTAACKAALARLGAAALELVRTRAELATLEFSEHRDRARTLLVLLGDRRLRVRLRGDVGHRARRRLFLGDLPDRGARRGDAVLSRRRRRSRSGACREHRRTDPPPFAATLAELERDRVWLAGHMRSDK